MCKYSIYKIKLPNGQFSTKTYSIDKLISMYDTTTIKRFLIKKRIVIIPCGKCNECLQFKKVNYKNKVSAQMKITKYSYLVTLTLNNEHSFTLLNKQDRIYCMSNQYVNNYSQFTNLSKLDIEKIIRNWKSKIWRYYKEKVSFNYFLCGEYGSNTSRAHYHVLLMLNKPIPNLVKQNVKGNHYKTDLFKSKQYDLYDIEPCDNKQYTSSYICKYLNKSSSYDYCNFNRFEEKQIRYMLETDKDVNHYKLWPNKEALIRDLIIYIFADNDDLKLLRDNLIIYRTDKKYKEVTRQKEFIKCSRRLGITDDIYFNYDNKVINQYYRNKYLTMWSAFYFDIFINNYYSYFYNFKWLNNHISIISYFIFLCLCFQLLFKNIELRRVSNITKFYGKNFNVKDYQQYKDYNSNDIF